MEIEEVLEKYRDLFKFVLNIDISSINEINLDKNIIERSNLVLDSNHLTEFQDYINSFNSNILIGGYLEERAIYDSSNNFSTNDEERRTIHIGIDFWCEENTSVICPIKGKVHSFNNNLGNGDYGPTIIIEHELDGIIFYTLYGHLSINSLEKMYIGKEIKTGEIFADLGNSQENGNWPAHLHFQLITNMLDYEGDFPGVVKKSEIEYWKKICLNPNLILNL